MVIVSLCLDFENYTFGSKPLLYTIYKKNCLCICTTPKIEIINNDVTFGLETATK